ncbi:MAG: type II toxin-antitoxin system VapC family toxin [Gemmatimonadota bacterium]|nr:type II toxin-antitoxin system VapC family toxin [Gemmatimonadota bacterium]MDE3174267.1 type II toxin-antitoxin system VapC family toxin [Gemmatimonadota bacterium]
MKVVDLNLLLYAANRDAPEHARARAWLERILGASEPVALPWAVLLGFLRVATSARVFPRPLSPAAALEVVDSWLAAPAVVALSPGQEHWPVLRRLIAESGTAGNLTTDAHLAALAIEHGAELCSTDADFVRFRELRWENPLVG